VGEFKFYDCSIGSWVGIDNFITLRMDSGARKVVPRNVNSLLLLHVPLDTSINILEDRIDGNGRTIKRMPIS